LGYDDITFTEYSLSQEQLDQIEIILQSFVKSGLSSVLLIDMAGNIVAKADDGKCEHDVYSLAALASANFAAVDTMAKIVGENEFSLLFHKGEEESIHFSRVMSDFLLLSIFGKEVSLGLLRLQVSDFIEKIKSIIAGGG
jgi:predicted regulator of Ras-like GTPase activity (Roadblock/LC7/MglB family)